MTEKISELRIACAVTFGLIIIAFACLVANTNPSYCFTGFGTTKEVTTYSIGDYYTCEEVRDMILLDVFPYDKTKQKIEYFCKREIEDITYYNFYDSAYVSYYRGECLK